MRSIRLAVWPLVAALFVAPAYGAEMSGQKMFGQERLDKLLTPIVRCSDDLLGKILEAATYPLEVTQAARLMQTNRNLSGPALASALAERTWDPSVKSLVNFPSILRRMNERIDWTQELGDAYLVQKTDVMDTVQTLRQKAKGPAGEDGAVGREVVADPLPSQGPPYSAPVAARQFGPGPAASTPVVIADSNVGTAGPAVERGWVATGWNLPRQPWPGYGRPVSYVLQGSPGSGGFARGGYTRQVAYGRGPWGQGARGFGVAAGLRGRSMLRAAMVRRASRRR